MKPRSWRCALILGVCLILSLAPAYGADDGHKPFSVALDGDTALVGVAGSSLVHVMVRSGSTWTDQGQLRPSDGTDLDSFGASVAIDGDTALVGAPGDDDLGFASGSAYVFVRSGGSWTLQAKLTAPDGTESDLFGWSVALEGDTAVVGAMRTDAEQVQPGAVYAFTRVGTTWAHETTITSPDGSHLFGFSVALDGDSVLIGAIRDSVGPDLGSAYLYTRQAGVWTYQAKLVAPDGVAYDRFGFSVALDGDTALVGKHPNSGGSGWGAAHVFTRTDGVWSHHAKLTAPDGTDGDAFGFSVALDAGTAIVGAPDDNDRGILSGAIHVFALSGDSWTHQAKLSPPDGAASDVFGSWLALSAGTAIVVSKSGIYVVDDEVFADAPPEARDDSYTLGEDGSLVVQSPGVLGNDVDPDTDEITATVVSQPLHGSLSLESDGSFIYAADAGYDGADAFTYRACSGWGCDTASVTLAAHPSTRVVTRTYLGSSVGPILLCSDEEPMSGGACFDVIPGESTVTFEVSDDQVTYPIGGWFRFQHSIGLTSDFMPFCGGTSTPVEPPHVPTDQVQLVIALDLYYGAVACGAPGVPTTGTITAEFS